MQVGPDCACSGMHAGEQSQLHIRLVLHTTCNTMRARIQYSTPMECLALLLAGMAMSTYGNGESVSQKAMVGMLT